MQWIPLFSLVLQCISCRGSPVLDLDQPWIPPGSPCGSPSSHTARARHRKQSMHASWDISATILENQNRKRFQYLGKERKRKQRKEKERKGEGKKREGKERKGGKGEGKKREGKEGRVLGPLPRSTVPRPFSAMNQNVQHGV